MSPFLSLEAWLAFCVTETVLCFTPGPAVLMVVSASLGRGMRAGLYGGLGVIAANTLYFALSAAGVGALLLASREVFLAIKWAGALYLVVFGLRMLLSRSEAPAEPAPDFARRSFLRGFVVQGANPKALVFFVALLPQFVDPTGPVGLQLLVLGASSAAIELVALGCYATAAARARSFARAGAVGPLRRVGGAFLVGAGARLAAVRGE